MSRFIFVMVVIFLLSGCGDECSSYSDFSCKKIKEATYNTYFYYPSGSEEYLGVVNGLDQCGSIAYDFAFSKNLTKNKEWGYICCMKAKGKECYEKHR